MSLEHSATGNHPLLKWIDWCTENYLAIFFTAVCAFVTIILLRRWCVPTPTTDSSQTSVYNNTILGNGKIDGSNGKTEVNINMPHDQLRTNQVPLSDSNIVDVLKSLKK